MTTLQLAHPGALPTQSASQLLRAPDGKMRIDMGSISIITDPASLKALVLDHVKLVARTVPIPQVPQVPGMPGMPGGLSAGLPKPAQVEDLGKAFIEGHEVNGMKYTFHPPALPSLPKPPAIPGMPAAPGIPQAPPIPTVAEVWTSASTKLPVLTTITGAFGQQVCHCKPAPPAAPPPAPTLFQVPPNYKLT
jgi:hypothetical protein